MLLVHSTDAIPEPFVTFLVEVNWARGRLMREYTVLLDPPVYTPGENANAAAPVAAPTTARAAPAPTPVMRRAPAPAAAPAPSSAGDSDPVTDCGADHGTQAPRRQACARRGRGP